jgi:hypothetical protein
MHRRSFLRQSDGNARSSLLHPPIPQYQRIHIVSAVHATPPDHVLPCVVRTRHVGVDPNHRPAASQALVYRLPHRLLPSTLRRTVIARSVLRQQLACPGRLRLSRRAKHEELSEVRPATASLTSDGSDTRVRLMSPRDRQALVQEATGEPDHTDSQESYIGLIRCGYRPTSLRGPHLKSNITLTSMQA